ncbi:ThiF family adenylyltransferase [Halobacteriovorax sp. RT-2-4]|uniref:ThiF family adenylyltransferase n=1 Tax=unclassified Halobacteriovorax TaxID=2639665 RepID=UPI00399A8952
MFSRNIGLITQEDQDKLQGASVLVCGVGGMGGVASEVLVRMGIGKIKIADFDRYEPHNSNRQIHCNAKNYDRYKVDVLEEEFRSINPNLKIKSFNEGVTKDNIEDLLDDVDIVINGMDEMFYSLILERAARRKNITIVDAWITPFASVFVMTPDSPHWEEYLDLCTKNTAVEDLTPELCNQAVREEVDFTFSHFSPYKYISKDLVDKIVTKEATRPSFTPVVWLSGVLMANEAYKVICGLPHTDHLGVFFDQYEFQLTNAGSKSKKGKQVKKAA